MKNAETSTQEAGLMGECDHVWVYSWQKHDLIECHICGEKLVPGEIYKILNNPTVKKMINFLISRRDDGRDT